MASLSEKRVVVTRPKAQCQDFLDLLEQAGAQPICFPVIEISGLDDTRELDQALQNLDSYDWLVLTSVNGVPAVWERMSALGISELPEGLKVACIGPKTAAAAAEVGMPPDFIPDEYVAEAILPGLGELEGLKVLLTRADIARPDLPEAIRAGGGIADDVCAYRTLPAETDQRVVAEIAKGTDILTFTSPSTVENFFQITADHGLDPLNLPGNPIIACIGPITARAAEKKGCRVAIVPDDYTIEGLTQAILEYFQENVHDEK